jgi:hypothetical protein
MSYSSYNQPSLLKQREAGVSPASWQFPNAPNCFSYAAELRLIGRWRRNKITAETSAITNMNI